MHDERMTKKISEGRVSGKTGWDNLSDLRKHTVGDAGEKVT